MRRAPIAVVSAAAGLAAVVGMHNGTRPTLAAALPASAGRSPSYPGGSPAPPSGPGSAGGSGSGTGSPSGSGAAGGSGSGTGSPSGSGAAGGSRSGSSGASTSGASGHATGPTEQYGYGQLAVAVTVSGGRITNVTVPSIQVADSYSGSIASQVIPMLRSQVLSAQSANIQGVSGATYTSEAYAMSLQAALTTLHFR